MTTHVLDVASGAPAAGVEVTLSARRGDGAWYPLATQYTDREGRIREWPTASPLAAGEYCLTFATGAYFAERGTPALYPEIVVHVRIGEQGAYHLPLLAGPFTYTTYRGH